MNKDEFLSALSQRLLPLEQMERVRMVQYYREIIEDRVEDGLTQEQAVEELEDLDEIATRILEEMGPTPKTQPVYHQNAPKKRSGLTTVLLILGFPVWLPLLCAAGIIVLSVYIVVWALVISLFAVVVSLGLAGVAGAIGFGVFFGTHFMPGLFLLGAGLACAGVGIALFFPITMAAKAMIVGTAGLGRWTWNRIFKRGGKEA